MSAETPGEVLLALTGGILLVPVALNALAELVAAILRLRTARIPTESAPAPQPTQGGTRPFFSVHVPAHDEPADLLIATIDALCAQDYPDFEIIVLDNNTPDPATWRPVAAHCRSLGPRVRFHHADAVEGAKAGALNLALALTDPRATHIAVVDADYWVAPDFLRQAVGALALHGADYVQFPQAYRHGAGARAVADELGDYFRAHAPAANATGSMLLTGTLSVIARPVLEAAGGWPTATITEDADLGLKLFRGGARGVFVDRRVGHGLLPLDLHGLMLQRHRWAAGNMQTLLGGLALRAPVPGWVSVLTQLLAWPGFGALPAAALLLAALLRIWVEPGPAWLAVEAVAAATLAAGLAAMLVEHALLKRRPETLAVRLALWWTASTAWIPLLWGSRPRFRRTPKAGSERSALPPLMAWGAGVLLAAALLLALTGAPVAGLALLLPLFSLPLALDVDRALRLGHAQLNDRERAPCAA